MVKLIFSRSTNIWESCLTEATRHCQLIADAMTSQIDHLRHRLASDCPYPTTTADVIIVVTDPEENPPPGNNAQPPDSTPSGKNDENGGGKCFFI